MKILQIIPYFIPAYGYGGPVKVCFDISKELVKTGHELTVVTTDTLDGKDRIENLREEIDGVKIIRFKNISNWLAKNCNGYLPIGFYGWIKNNIQNFDVVHCHDFFTYQNIVTAYFCKKYKIPLIVQPHGSAVPEKARGRQFIKIIFNVLWGKKIINETKKIIALTIEEKNNIEKYFSTSKVKIIPNGIAIDKSEKINIYDIREKYGFRKDSLLILSLGRLHKIKGFDLLINSFAIFKEKFPNSYLFIAGPDEGELENLKKIVIEKQLSNYVFFTGMLLGDEKRMFLSQCDIFALFSRNEPFPLVVLEALEASTPVILSEKIGIASDIESLGAGKVTNPYNSPLSAEILEECVKNIDELKLNTKEAVKKFDISKVANDIIELYRRSIRKMDKLKFEINDSFVVDKYTILCDSQLKLAKNNTLIREVSQFANFPSGFKKMLEKIAYSCISLRNYLFVDGFIQLEIRKIISKYFQKDDIFLEIGCGDMALNKYLPKDAHYNAFDVSLHRYYLSRLLDHNKQANVCLASIHNIPLPNESVSFLVLSEVLYEVPNIDKAMSEISRVIKKDGILVISLSNAYCHKYEVKGAHPLLKNSWTFDGFVNFASKNNFALLHGYKKGWWIPMPMWLTKTSYQLPITSKKEHKNTTFFYVFKKL